MPLLKNKYSIGGNFLKVHASVFHGRTVLKQGPNSANPIKIGSISTDAANGEVLKTRVKVSIKTGAASTSNAVAD